MLRFRLTNLTDKKNAKINNYYTIIFNLNVTLIEKRKHQGTDVISSSTDNTKKNRQCVPFLKRAEVSISIMARPSVWREDGARASVQHNNFLLWKHSFNFLVGRCSGACVPPLDGWNLICLEIHTLSLWPIKVLLNHGKRLPVYYLIPIIITILIYDCLIPNYMETRLQINISKDI